MRQVTGVIWLTAVLAGCGGGSPAEPADGWFPDQRLTIEEAIDAYTRAPAWASFEEDIKGTLTPRSCLRSWAVGLCLRQIRAEASALILQVRGFRTMSEKTFGKIHSLLNFSHLSTQIVDAALQRLQLIADTL